MISSITRHWISKRSLGLRHCTTSVTAAAAKTSDFNKKIDYPVAAKLLPTKPTVCVGLSGGVDSLVAAYLLKQQGFNVKCAYIKSWDEKDELGYCSGERDYQDAIQIAKRLDLPLHHADFVKEYWNRVFEGFLADYRAGYTPNPDVFCNREIKFDVFTTFAESIGADYIATGHYSQLDYNQDGSVRLRQGADHTKDQSYFLCMTEGHKLARAIFPIGPHIKHDVVALANQLKYDMVTQKKSSRGICFIGKRPLPDFLQQYIPMEPGYFVDPMGVPLGKHRGAICYTIGQKANIASQIERVLHLDRFYASTKKTLTFVWVAV
eukprot:gene19513-23376_t